MDIVLWEGGEVSRGGDQIEGTVSDDTTKFETSLSGDIHITPALLTSTTSSKSTTSVLCWLMMI